ncbi:MAG: hypothetical protein RRA15_08515 [bacterium]|nr:hypothetical protein [bacterium]MDT8366523.1 hypothetical protein [bacterium]
MKKTLQISLIIGLVLILSTFIAFAADLPAKDAKILKEAGIPLYKGVEFINGGLGDEVVGARFASSAPVEDVRAFYQDKFPDWALNAEYGAWILYVGEPGGGPAAYMGKQQISVATNKNLPEWFGLAGNMTTEIIIVVPPK